MTFDKLKTYVSFVANGVPFSLPMLMEDSREVMWVFVSDVRISGDKSQFKLEFKLVSKICREI